MVKIAIWMVSYNHEAYISHAIDSIIMQVTNFDFCLYIGEDFSTDTTRQICIDYKKKYPDKIKLILQKSNIGAHNNADTVYEAVLNSGAEYIAFCEGDDYWVGNNKLQRQVDFLDSNYDYSLCFHNAFLLRQGISLNEKFRKYKKNTYSTKDVILENWLSPTASILFRSEVLRKKPLPLAKEGILNRDLLLVFNASLVGKLYCIDEVMSVYRCNVKGGATDNIKNISQRYKNYIIYLNYINKKTNFKYVGYVYLRMGYILLAYFKSKLLNK